MGLQGVVSRSAQFKKCSVLRRSRSSSQDSDSDITPGKGGSPCSQTRDKFGFSSLGSKRSYFSSKLSPGGFRRTRPGAASGAIKAGLSPTRYGGRDSPRVLPDGREASGGGKPLRSVTAKWLRDLEGVPDTSQRRSRNRVNRSWVKEIEAMTSAGSRPNSLSPLTRSRPGATAIVTRKDIARLLETSPASNRGGARGAKKVAEDSGSEVTSQVDYGDVDSSHLDIERLLEYDLSVKKTKKQTDAFGRKARLVRKKTLLGGERERHRGSSKDESDSDRSSELAKSKLERLREDISRLEKLVDVTGEKLGTLESPFFLPPEIATTPSPLSCLEEHGGGEEASSVRASRKGVASLRKLSSLARERTLEKDKSIVATETSDILRGLRKESAASQIVGQSSSGTGGVLNGKQAMGSPSARQRSLSPDMLTLQNIAEASRRGKQHDEAMRIRGRSPLRAELPLRGIGHSSAQVLTNNAELSTISTSFGLKTETNTLPASTSSRIDDSQFLSTALASLPFGGQRDSSAEVTHGLRFSSSSQRKSLLGTIQDPTSSLSGRGKDEAAFSLRCNRDRSAQFGDAGGLGGFRSTVQRSPTSLRDTVSRPEKCPGSEICPHFISEEQKRPDVSLRPFCNEEDPLRHLQRDPPPSVCHAAAIPPPRFHHDRREDFLTLSMMMNTHQPFHHSYYTQATSFIPPYPPCLDYRTSSCFPSFPCPPPPVCQPHSLSTCQGSCSLSRNPKTTDRTCQTAQTESSAVIQTSSQNTDLSSVPSGCPPDGPWQVKEEDEKEVGQLKVLTPSEGSTEREVINHSGAKDDNHGLLPSFCDHACSPIHSSHQENNLEGKKPSIEHPIKPLVHQELQQREEVASFPLRSPLHHHEAPLDQKAIYSKTAADSASHEPQKSSIHPVGNALSSSTHLLSTVPEGKLYQSYAPDEFAKVTNLPCQENERNLLLEPVDHTFPGIARDPSSLPVWSERSLRAPRKPPSTDPSSLLNDEENKEKNCRDPLHLISPSSSSSSSSSSCCFLNSSSLSDPYIQKGPLLSGHHSSCDNKDQLHSHLGIDSFRPSCERLHSSDRTRFPSGMTPAHRSSQHPPLLPSQLMNDTGFSCQKPDSLNIHDTLTSLAVGGDGGEKEVKESGEDEEEVISDFAFSQEGEEPVCFSWFGNFWCPGLAGERKAEKNQSTAQDFLPSSNKEGHEDISSHNPRLSSFLTPGKSDTLQSYPYEDETNLKMPSLSQHQHDSSSHQKDLRKEERCSSSCCNETLHDVEDVERLLSLSLQDLEREKDEKEKEEGAAREQACHQIISGLDEALRNVGASPPRPDIFPPSSSSSSLSSSHQERKMNGVESFILNADSTAPYRPCLEEQERLQSKEKKEESFLYPYEDRMTQNPVRSVDTLSRDEALRRIFSLPSLISSSHLTQGSEIQQKGQEREVEEVEEEEDLCYFENPEDPEFHRGLSRRQLSVELKLVHDMLINLMDSEVSSTMVKERKEEEEAKEEHRSRRREEEEEEEEERNRRGKGREKIPSSSLRSHRPLHSENKNPQEREKIHEWEREERIENKEGSRRTEKGEKKGIYTLDLKNIYNPERRQRRIFTSPLRYASSQNSKQEKKIEESYERIRRSKGPAKGGEEEILKSSSEERRKMVSRNDSERKLRDVPYCSILLKDGWKLKKEISSLPWNAPGYKPFKEPQTLLPSLQEEQNAHDRQEEPRHRFKRSTSFIEEEKKRENELRHNKISKKNIEEEEEGRFVKGRREREQEKESREEEEEEEKMKRERRKEKIPTFSLNSISRQSLRGSLPSGRVLTRSATTSLPHGWYEDSSERASSNYPYVYSRCRKEAVEELDGEELFPRKRERIYNSDAHERETRHDRDEKRILFMKRRAVSMPVLSKENPSSSSHRRKKTFQQNDDDNDNGRREERKNDRSLILPRHHHTPLSRKTSGVHTPQRHGMRSNSRLREIEEEDHEREKGQNDQDYLLFAHSTHEDEEEEERASFFSSSTVMSTRGSLVPGAEEEERREMMMLKNSSQQKTHLIPSRKKGIKGSQGKQSIEEYSSFDSSTVSTANSDEAAHSYSSGACTGEPSFDRNISSRRISQQRTPKKQPSSSSTSSFDSFSPISLDRPLDRRSHRNLSRPPPRQKEEMRKNERIYNTPEESEEEKRSRRERGRRREMPSERRLLRRAMSACTKVPSSSSSSFSSSTFRDLGGKNLCKKMSYSERHQRGRKDEEEEEEGKKQVRRSSYLKSKSQPSMSIFMIDQKDELSSIDKKRQKRKEQGEKEAEERKKSSLDNSSFSSSSACFIRRRKSLSTPSPGAKRATLPEGTSQSLSTEKDRDRIRCSSIRRSTRQKENEEGGGEEEEERTDARGNLLSRRTSASAEGRRRERRRRVFSSSLSTQDLTRNIEDERKKEKDRTRKKSFFPSSSSFADTPDRYANRTPRKQEESSRCSEKDLARKKISHIHRDKKKTDRSISGEKGERRTIEKREGHREMKAVNLSERSNDPSLLSRKIEPSERETSGEIHEGEHRKRRSVLPLLPRLLLSSSSSTLEEKSSSLSSYQQDTPTSSSSFYSPSSSSPYSSSCLSPPASRSRRERGACSKGRVEDEEEEVVAPSSISKHEQEKERRKSEERSARERKEKNMKRFGRKEASSSSSSCIDSELRLGGQRSIIHSRERKENISPSSSTMELLSSSSSSQRTAKRRETCQDRWENRDLHGEKEFYERKTGKRNERRVKDMHGERTKEEEKERTTRWDGNEGEENEEEEEQEEELRDNPSSSSSSSSCFSLSDFPVKSVRARVFRIVKCRKARKDNLEEREEKIEEAFRGKEEEDRYAVHPSGNMPIISCVSSSSPMVGVCTPENLSSSSLDDSFFLSLVNKQNFSHQELQRRARRVKNEEEEFYHTEKEKRRLRIEKEIDKKTKSEKESPSPSSSEHKEPLRRGDHPKHSDSYKDLDERKEKEEEGESLLLGRPRKNGEREKEEEEEEDSFPCSSCIKKGEIREEEQRNQNSFNLSSRHMSLQQLQTEGKKKEKNLSLLLSDRTRETLSSILSTDSQVSWQKTLSSGVCVQEKGDDQDEEEEEKHSIKEQLREKRFLGKGNGREEVLAEVLQGRSLEGIERPDGRTPREEKVCSSLRVSKEKEEEEAEDEEEEEVIELTMEAIEDVEAVTDLDERRRTRGWVEGEKAAEEEEEEREETDKKKKKRILVVEDELHGRAFTSVDSNTRCFTGLRKKDASLIEEEEEMDGPKQEKKKNRMREGDHGMIGNGDDEEREVDKKRGIDRNHGRASSSAGRRSACRGEEEEAELEERMKRKEERKEENEKKTCEKETKEEKEKKEQTNPRGKEEEEEEEERERKRKDLERWLGYRSVLEVPMHGDAVITPDKQAERERQEKNFLLRSLSRRQHLLAKHRSASKDAEEGEEEEKHLRSSSSSTSHPRHLHLPKTSPSSVLSHHTFSADKPNRDSRQHQEGNLRKKFALGAAVPQRSSLSSFSSTSSTVCIPPRNTSSYFSSSSSLRNQGGGSSSLASSSSFSKREKRLAHDPVVALGDFEVPCCPSPCSSSSSLSLATPLVLSFEKHKRENRKNEEEEEKDTQKQQREREDNRRWLPRIREEEEDEKMRREKKEQRREGAKNSLGSVSNRAIVCNALRQVCLAGELNRERRRILLSCFNSHWMDYRLFLILLKNTVGGGGGHELRALYAHDPTRRGFIKVAQVSPSPATLKEDQVEKMFRYDCARRCFSCIEGARTFSPLTVGVTLKWTYTPASSSSTSLSKLF